MSKATPRDFGSLAPIVVEHARSNDPMAIELMQRAATHIDALALRLVSLGTERIALVGGLVAQIGPAAGRRTARAVSSKPGSRRSRCVALRAAVPGARSFFCIGGRYMSDLHMAAEFREAPDVVQRQTQILRNPVAALCIRLAAAPPAFVVTCARGSSAHAATFGKHLIERHLGIPVAAAAPNISTIYRRSLRLRGQLFVTISQSGRSDDLVEMTLMAKAAGALPCDSANDTEARSGRAANRADATPEPLRSRVSSQASPRYCSSSRPGRAKGRCRQRLKGCRTI